MAEFFKIFNSDYTSPIRGGASGWNGSIPFELPEVDLDTSSKECGRGWNFVNSIANGFKIAGMWRTGRPLIVAIVQPSADAIQRKDKWRASSLKITGMATEEQITRGIEELSEPFGEFKAEMVSEQIAWRYALGRPEYNKEAVVNDLEKALSLRQLHWTVKEFSSAWDAWDARAARDGGRRGLRGLRGLRWMRGLRGLCGMRGMCGLRGMRGMRGLRGMRGMRGRCGLLRGMRGMRWMR